MRYSTTQVAKLLKLKQPNLQKLIREKKIPFPPIALVGGLWIRLWSKRDVARVRKLPAVRRKRRNNEEAYKWPSNRSHFSIWQVVVWALAKR